VPALASVTLPTVSPLTSPALVKAVPARVVAGHKTFVALSAVIVRAAGVTVSAPST
jgi:hypothetical protein